MIISRSARAALLVSAALLAGCSTLGPATRLEAPSAAQFRNAEGLGQSLNVPPLADKARWWQSTGDPELARLVDKALTANLDIAAAQSRLAEADAFVKRARADRLPGGSIDASVAEQRQSLEGPLGSFARDVPGFLRDQTIFDAGARANWEIDLFGRLGAAARAARANRSETAALLDGVRIRIAAETADAYVTLAGANEQIAILTAQRELAAQLAETVRRRLAAGTATRTEVDRAEGELARLDAFLPQARIAAEAQRNRLYVLTGGDELTGPPTAVPLIPVLASINSPADVLRARPDVRAAEARVTASDARVGSALAEYYPSLSIGGLIGFQSIDSDRLFTSSALNAQGLIGIRWRLFDFARIDAEVAAARARGDQALAGYRAALLLATEDVENNLYAVVARETQLREAERAKSSTGKATLDARRTFEAGIIGLPAKLQSERRLLEAEQEALDARLASARARIALFRATAGGVTKDRGLP
jgi:NodT family efflux transporter outer membrane factor (OMF) lipoprotein